MRREKFAEWLSRRSYKGAQLTPTANRNRVGWLKALERALPLIGLPHSDLDAVHAGGAWSDLMARMAAIRSDWRSNEKAARSMAPEATDPTGQIINILASARLYGHFADGKDPNYDDEGDAGAGDGSAAGRPFLLFDAADVAFQPVRNFNRTTGVSAFRIKPKGAGNKAEEAIETTDIVQVARAMLINGLAARAKAISGGTVNYLTYGGDKLVRYELSPELATVLGIPAQGRAAGSTTASGGSAAAPKIHERVSPMNLILYGPPGTGKTFATAREAVKLCSPSVDLDNRAAVEAEYGRLVEARQVEFVTFHQSYSYEDFVEGLRPPVSSKDGEGDEDKSGFRLEVSPGVFHRIATRAAASKGSTGKSFDLTGRQVFKMSIGEAANPEDAYLFEESLENGYALLGFGQIDWGDERFAKRDAMIEAWKKEEPESEPPTPRSASVQCPDMFRNWIKPGDIVIVSKGNGSFRAIGEVTGPYEYAPRDDGGYFHRRAVNWLWSDRAGVPVEEIYAKRFSMRTLYMLTTSDLNMSALQRYITSQEPGGPPEPFVLIIDEINRANISKVFGELITLLEPDKRLTPDGGGLKVRLPYSKEAFGVPANLHVIGTMNTADRSIALLDTALRRRFEFRELMPDPDLPEMKVAGARCGVDLGKLLRTLNDRIEYLFDREHQIGHAYFINCASRADLDAVMRHKVIPLLAEYFYEDWSKVALVLGDADASKSGRFLDRTELKPPAGSDFEGGDTRWRWTVRSAFSADAYADFQ